jgi:GTP cyclohydrolase II
MIEAGGQLTLALPAETASEATLAEFLAEAGADPVLVLARSRAAAFAQQAGDGESCVAFALDPSRLTLTGLRSLADPTARQMPSPCGEIRPVRATEPGWPALLLAKRARLLPAMLLAPFERDAATTDMLMVRQSDILQAAAQGPAQPGASSGLVAVAEADLPLQAATARMVAFRPEDGGIEHLAILIGAPLAAPAPLVRVHSECFTGDRLGSLRCDCGPQLEGAIRRMAAEGAGILLYMAQEGRGIGLVNKLRAYTLQDRGLDTLDANHALGFAGDERDFADAATMLKQLGVTRIRLLTNNPGKIAALALHGIEVTGRVAHAIAANGVNDAYLATKARRFGHLLG